MSQYLEKLELLSDALSRASARPWWETGGKICNVAMFLLTLYTFKGYSSQLLCIRTYNEDLLNPCPFLAQKEVLDYLKYDCVLREMPMPQRFFSWFTLFTVLLSYILHNWWLYVPVVQTALKTFAEVMRMGRDMLLTGEAVKDALERLRGQRQLDADSNREDILKVEKIRRGLEGVAMCKQIVILSTIRSELALTAYYLLLALYLYMLSNGLAKGGDFRCGTTGIVYQSTNHFHFNLSCPRELTCRYTGYETYLLLCFVYGCGVGVQASFSLIALCRTTIYRKIKLHGVPKFNLARFLLLLFLPWLDMLRNITECGCCDGCNDCCKPHSGQYRQLNASDRMDAVEFLLNMENRSRAIPDTSWFRLIVDDLTERDEEAGNLNAQNNSTESSITTV